MPFVFQDLKRRLGKQGTGRQALYQGFTILEGVVRELLHAWLDFVASGGVTVRVDGTEVGTRHQVNFIAGTGVTLLGVDDTATPEIDVTFASVSSAAGAYALVSDTVLTGSGNHARAAGATHYSAELVGGGGGGGGTESGLLDAAAAGGESGEYVHVPLTSWGVATELAYSVGAGGSGGSGAEGAEGGETTLGAHAADGGGGGHVGEQVVGPAVTFADNQGVGAPGGAGLILAANVVKGGDGGASIFGGTAGASNAAGAAAASLGAGGAGASDTGSESSRDGGDGGDGYLRVKQWETLT